MGLKGFDDLDTTNARVLTTRLPGPAPGLEPGRHEFRDVTVFHGDCRETEAKTPLFEGVS